VSPQQRLAELEQWLASLPNHALRNIRPASADASFRRYFRVDDSLRQASFVVMDAPPDKEDCSGFIHITGLLRGAGVHAPEILASNEARGFLLLSDLGDRQYLDHLNEDSADRLYTDALTSLVRMQQIEDGLPAYDEARLTAEMDLFEPWYLNRHLGIELDDALRGDLRTSYDILLQAALEQPRVFVHRDYHSRNLMLLDEDNPGVIDYQDAVIGPVTYDLVSLFKDCYIEWPRQRIERWLTQYLDLSPYLQHTQRDTFIRWFDLMGVQRHLKVLGIFARLNYRDGKAHYLDDLPLTLKYVVQACQRYPELAPLMNLINKTALKSKPGQ
jgi:aminoglycoside/choline kinase family phosphotransferase